MTSIQALSDAQTTELANKAAAVKGYIASAFTPEHQNTLNSFYTDLKLPNALKVGDKAPGFVLPSLTKESVDLTQKLSQGPVVLIFYRGAWCPFCMIQIHALEKAAPEFVKLNATIIAISGTISDPTAEAKATEGLQIVYDQDFKTSNQYGVTYKLSPELYAIQTENFGLDWAKLYGSEGVKNPQLNAPAAFVIDRSGKITYAHVLSDFKERVPIAELFQAVKTL